MDETTAAPLAEPRASQGAGGVDADGDGDGDGDDTVDRAAGPADDRDGRAVGTALAAVRDSVLDLLAGFPHPPAELRVQAGDVTVEASWNAAPPAGAVEGPGNAPPPAVTTSNGEAAAEGATRLCLHSPTVGTFYRAPEPGAAPFVQVGDVVTVGQQVAIVETMKLMIPVKAEAGGTIAEVLKDDGESVEHGEALFVLADGP